MIRALLIDLDHTLLQTNLDEFLPAYTGRLAEAIGEEVPDVDAGALIFSATQEMIANKDPRSTLQQVFAARFYPALGAAEETLEPTIDQFFDKIYPELQDLTQPVAAAPQLIERARKAGLQVALATNPIFPRTAIEQRLGWAGFDSAMDEFDVIPGYESFHFAKPNPEYFSETLGLLGVESRQAAMVGDDERRDITPAKMLGMHTFQIEAVGDGGNSMEEVWHWLQSLIDADEESSPPLVAAVLARLRGYLSALLQLTAGPMGQEWSQRPSPREWALVEILCHLRDTEREVNHARLRRMLTEDTPFISAVNPDEWAEERRYLDQDPTQALEDFTEARLQTIAQVAQLPPERWQSPARHALLGPTTLLEILDVATHHDLLHLDQLRRTKLEFG